MKRDRNEINALVSQLIDGKPVDWGEVSREASSSPAVGALGEIASLRGFAVRAMGTRTEQSPAGHDVWGPLEIRGMLGRGANAQVLRGWDAQLQHEVALKVSMRTDAEDAIRTRMLNEGRRMVRVRHDNVVRIYGVLEHDGQIGLSMELVEGQTLAERVSAEGSSSESEARAAGIAVADALCALHESGIVHQDVKAQNVIRETGGRLVLMDLGSGVELGSDHLMPGGTPYYMAPELITGGTAGRSSDVYSLGVLLHYLVTGAFPYEGASLSELQEAHRKPRALTLGDRRPGLSTAFVNAVERALDPDPGMRFQTAGEFREALSVEPVVKLDPSRRWWLSVATIGIAALAIWAGWSWTNRGFEVEAHIYRYEDATSRVELMSGAGVEVGDMLTLELELSDRMHVYVLNEDDQGRLYVLFPIGDSALENPLTAGNHELPGVRESGSRITWEVSSTGGRERLLVVIDRDRVEAIEAALDRIPQATMAYPRVDASLLRGIGGVVELSTGPGGSGDSLLDIQELVGGRQRGQDRWVRQFVLSNP